MDHFAVPIATSTASAHASRFTGPGGVAEYHLIVLPTEYGGIEQQLAAVHEAYRDALAHLGIAVRTAIHRRYFCSDVVNQRAVLEARALSSASGANEPCAISWVGQPPSPPAKVALWAYHISDPAGELDKNHEGTSLTLRRGDLAHHWTTGVICPEANTSYDQTRGILAQYETCLSSWGSTLADNVIRTWFLVQNVDANYHGLVVARREVFAERGLTPETHYIASTGIEGYNAEISARVTMDAYAISGVGPDQVRYLAALDHLSPTHVYGVTFERGASVSYADRDHVYISGTASIDKHGEIMHVGDVTRQLDRTLENVEALLSQAGATLADMCSFIVYVRDPSDHAIAWERMRRRFPEAPVVVVVAPVCRPGWLIEVEGTAVVRAEGPGLPRF
jgi:enamine deaminase RidA (YjgF/YER057c/UK114 family)